MSNTSANSYWEANIKLVLSLLSVWFLISFVCGILLVDVLDNIRLKGFKLGFWIAQQGSILTFIVLILIYIRAMDKLDSQYKQAAGNGAQNTGEKSQ
jgi:putative solute:sodium symporter small subunit